jgi:hypothetical protein
MKILTRSGRLEFPKGCQTKLWGFMQSQMHTYRPRLESVSIELGNIGIF